jgi:hypothetical protein
MSKLLRNIYYSFPVQLLILHFRSNLLLIFTWILLALLISGQVGNIFGIKYLFLSPEYLGHINFWSFFIVGFWFGAFLMSWNLTTYLLDAHRFPFIATMAKPFTKFCINNFIVPFSFFVFYFCYIVYFQSYYELRSFENIMWNCTGFLLGMTLLISLLALYFQFTNKDILNFEKTRKIPPNLSGKLAPGRPYINIDSIRENRTKWKVETYLSTNLQPMLVRSVTHYDKETLFKVFKQNHLNVLLVQLSGFFLLILLGVLIDNPYSRMPAASSVFILLCMLIALTGAITFWFGKWRLTIIILMLVTVQQLTKYDFFNRENRAYGLNYNIEKTNYTNQSLDLQNQPKNLLPDVQNTIAILDNWKKKQLERKPKMILLCVSGGGMKAATWTTQVIQQVDKALGGALMQHTSLISGASGGMLGVAYLRELYLQKALGREIDVYSEQYIDDISTDLLNSITFTIVSNDLFLPWATFKSGGYQYHKDRGYIFEKQFNENTHHLLDKTISAYKIPEQEAVIPMMFITPSIVNDGRRMVISPQGVSYMTKAPIAPSKSHTVMTDAVDFGRMFQKQDAMNLKFTTALRMNATYPYILPNVHLPSVPEIEVLDAGFRDNHGITSSSRFIHVFKDWILENTSGVVLVQIDTKDKISDITPSDEDGLIGSIFNPLGIVGKLLKLQEFEHDTNLGFIFDLLGESNFDLIRFSYLPTEKNEKASMTYHLTEREKQDILNAFYLKENQENLENLKEIMGTTQTPISIKQ